MGNIVFYTAMAKLTERKQKVSFPSFIKYLMGRGYYWAFSLQTDILDTTNFSKVQNAL